MTCLCQKRGLTPFGPKPCPPALDREQGCSRDAELDVLVIGGYAFRRCPARLVTHATAEVLRYAAFARRGVLPLAGGLLDQCETFVRAMEIIDRALAEAGAVANE